MKKLTQYISTTALILGLASVGPVSATANDNWDMNQWSALDGQIFAIEGEYIYNPFGIPSPFVNCYTFNADETPNNGLNSGVWDDPLFPAPGTWVQHTSGGVESYTAFANDGAGISLIQNGTVTGNGASLLKAYTIVSIAGFGVIAEIVSTGRSVDSCPYDD